MMHILAFDFENTVRVRFERGKTTRRTKTKKNISWAGADIAKYDGYRDRFIEGQFVGGRNSPNMQECGLTSRNSTSELSIVLRAKRRV